MIYKILVGDEHGGAATSSTEIINAFLDKRDDFRVVFLSSGRFSNTFKSKNVSVLNSKCPPVIQSTSKIKALLNYISFFIWLINTTIRLNRFIKKNNVKYIHTTNNHALLVCLLCKLFSPDLYLITHWRCIGLSISSKYRKLLFRIDKIIAISKAVKQSLPQELHDRIIVIYNGIDVEKIYTKNVENQGKLRKLLNISNDTFLVGTIGSYTAIKCHELMIESIALSENKNYVMVLMGSAPNVDSENYLLYLKRKVAEYNLNDRVLFVDNTIISRPNEYLSDLDLFVAATWYNGVGEGFGLVYVEAMAAKLPVVAINVGAAGEIITKETGFLMKENSAIELSNIIASTIKNSELKFMRNSIVERAKIFDISETINNIQQLYKTLK